MTSKAKGQANNRLPPIDYSMLRPPIDLGLVGAVQVSRCLSSGTAEMRDLLLEECDLIFECKVCRNLFRSLANFIAHKRVYCKDCFEETKLNFVEKKPAEQTVIVQPKAPSEKPETAVTALQTNCDKGDEAQEDKTGCPPKQSQKKPTVWQQMLAGTFLGKSPSYNFYTKAVERTLKKEECLKTCVVALEPVEGNPNAMFQSVTNDVSQSDIDTAVRRAKTGGYRKKMAENESQRDNKTEICEPSDKGLRTSLRRKTSRMTAGNNTKKPSTKESDDTKSKICVVCKTSYSNLRALKVHMHTAHKDLHIVFPCPLCKSFRKNLTNLRRHLRSSHNRSKQWLNQNMDRLKQKSVAMSNDQLPSHLKSCLSGQTTAGKDTSSAKASKSETNLRSLRNARVARCQSKSISSSASEVLLFKCLTCDKTFSKSESLSRHQSFCLGLDGLVSLDSSSVSSCSLSSQGLSADDASKDDAGEDHRLDGTDSESRIGDFRPKLQANHRWSTRLTEDEVKKITKLIDEKRIICLKCNRRYGNVSNLHRHAVRHLGWRRFQCTLCEFTGYNRSECKTHLQRVHCQKANSDLNKLILDLEPDKIKAGVSSLSRVESKRMSSLRIFEKIQQARKQQQLSNCNSGDRSMPGVDVANIHRLEQSKQFNISTRSSPRKFDTTPYRPVDHMTVLLTRSGCYTKAASVSHSDTSSEHNVAKEPEQPSAGCEQHVEAADQSDQPDSGTAPSFPPDPPASIKVEERVEEAASLPTDPPEVIPMESANIVVKEEVVVEMDREEDKLPSE